MEQDTINSRPTRSAFHCLGLSSVGGSTSGFGFSSFSGRDSIRTIGKLMLLWHDSPSSPFYPPPRPLPGHLDRLSCLLSLIWPNAFGQSPSATRSPRQSQPISSWAVASTSSSSTECPGPIPISTIPTWRLFYYCHRLRGAEDCTRLDRPCPVPFPSPDLCPCPYGPSFPRGRCCCTRCPRCTADGGAAVEARVSTCCDGLCWKQADSRGAALARSPRRSSRIGPCPVPARGSAPVLCHCDDGDMKSLEGEAVSFWSIAEESWNIFTRKLVERNPKMSIN